MKACDETAWRRRETIELRRGLFDRLSDHEKRAAKTPRLLGIFGDDVFVIG
jgi:hypothetical protein